MVGQFDVSAHMEELRLGDQFVRYDRQATVTAYVGIPSGGAERCGCSYCRNFAAQRNLAYPEAFRTLLDQLGIYSRKEGEAYEMGPARDGTRLYGGWFFFVGELIEKGERLIQGGDFQYWFRPSFPRPPASFGNQVAAIEFSTQVPWVLEESPC